MEVSWSYAVVWISSQRPQLEHVLAQSRPQSPRILALKSGTNDVHSLQHAFCGHRRHAEGLVLVLASLHPVEIPLPVC